MKILLVALFTGILLQTGVSQSPRDTVVLSDDIEIVYISEHVIMHVSYTQSPRWGRIGANGLIVINDKEAILLDSPWTNAQTETLLSWIRDSMKLELTAFVPNHWHEDCMGGLACIQQHGIRSYANEMTIDLAESHGLPLPDVGFRDSLELRLDEKAIHCYYLGAAHSTDNIVVWIPSEQILFPACMVKDMRSRNLGNTADGDLSAYPLTLEKLLGKFPDAKIVVPGHGEAGGQELIKHTLELARN